MKVVFRKSFARDLKKIKDKAVLAQVQQAIEQAESAPGPADVKELKKLGGATDCYRIRIGEYRLGILIDEDTLEFVRCLNRRDLYRFFP